MIERKLVAFEKEYLPDTRVYLREDMVAELFNQVCGAPRSDQPTRTQSVGQGGLCAHRSSVPSWQAVYIYISINIQVEHRRTHASGKLMLKTREG